MKNILYGLLGVLLIAVTSCTEIDNWDAPDSGVHGRIIDSYTGQNILSSQNDFVIRIWERSWTVSVPAFQTLTVKQDGSYNNSKLFAGTYDMLVYGGPFWPKTDTTKNVIFSKGGNTEQDITVTPYLRLSNFTATLNGTNLTLACKVDAPITTGLPNIVEVKGFISTKPFSGASNFIDRAEYNNLRIQLNKTWAQAIADPNPTTGILGGNATLGPFLLKKGYTYYVRLGANVNDANRKYNYTEIIKVEVPAN